MPQADVHAINLRCIRCLHSPEELEEYVDLALTGNYLSATAACRSEEGTLNPRTGFFACTECYLAMGNPSGPGAKRWRAGDPIPIRK